MIACGIIFAILLPLPIEWALACSPEVAVAAKGTHDKGTICQIN